MMHFLSSALWIFFLGMIVFELFTIVFAWHKQRLGALVILGLLMVQILPPPIFMILDRQYPHPFHDVPLDFGPMGLALILNLFFLFIFLVPVGAVLTLLILIDAKRMRRASLTDKKQGA